LMHAVILLPAYQYEFYIFFRKLWLVGVSMQRTLWLVLIQPTKR
jgi:hypothetical protein